MLKKSNHTNSSISCLPKVIPFTDKIFLHTESSVTELVKFNENIDVRFIYIINFITSEVILYYVVLTTNIFSEFEELYVFIGREY